MCALAIGGHSETGGKFVMLDRVLVDDFCVAGRQKRFAPTVPEYGFQRGEVFPHRNKNEVPARRLCWLPCKVPHKAGSAAHHADGCRGELLGERRLLARHCARPEYSNDWNTRLELRFSHASRPLWVESGHYVS